MQLKAYDNLQSFAPRTSQLSTHTREKEPVRLPGSELANSGLLRADSYVTCTMMAIRSESLAMFSLHFLHDARPLLAYSAL